MSSIKLKLTNSGGVFIPTPATVPTITTAAIGDLSGYSNTSSMLANVATAYSNAVNYVDNQGFANGAMLAANLALYVKKDELTLASITDVQVAGTPPNNSTLVYDSATNKYVVKQLELNGGDF